MWYSIGTEEMAHMEMIAALVHKLVAECAKERFCGSGRWMNQSKHMWMGHRPEEKE